MALNVPLTPQTDPKNFPDYIFRRYPKMICREATMDDVAANLRKRMADPATGACLDPEWRPLTVGQTIPSPASLDHVTKGYANSVGDPIVVRNPGEEFDVTGEMPDDPAAFNARTEVSLGDPADKARIAALETELAAQRTMMQEMLALLKGNSPAPPQPEEATDAKGEDDDEPVPPRRVTPPGRRTRTQVIEGD